MENKSANATWLLENGSPAIRMRTQRDLLNQPVDEGMISDLLDYGMTQKWMERLLPNPHFWNMHGSKPEHFENVCGKLRELGFDVGMSPEWAATLQPYVDFLEKEKGEHGLSELSLIFAFAPLVTIGYTHPAMVNAAVEHLNQVGDFCSQMNYDIYIEPDAFGGMYKAYEGRKLLNPAFNNRLPTIWDIYMLAYMPRTQRKEEIERAASAIIEYILRDEYQRLPHGYGIMYHPPTKKYDAHGWNVFLPYWFPNSNIPPFQEASFVQRLELMACFPQAIQTVWFQNGLAALEEFRNGDNRYRFPTTMLKEGSSGYYVTGTYMRLEENRHRKIAMELDATFRVELVKKRVSAFNRD